jgi:hypothetical protein
MLVIVSNPDFKGLDQCKRTGPFLEPQALLPQRPYDSFRVRMTLGVAIAGKALLDPQDPTDLHIGGVDRERSDMLRVSTNTDSEGT